MIAGMRGKGLTFLVLYYSLSGKILTGRLDFTAVAPICFALARHRKAPQEGAGIEALCGGHAAES